MKNRLCSSIIKFCVVALVLGVSACDLPERSADYREAHPVSVQPETRELALMTRVEAETLTSEDQFAFDGFIRDFHLRASGPIGIQIPANSASGIERKARIESITSLLVSAGVDRRAITELPPDGGTGSSLVISFATSKVIVPECGHWAEPSSYNWANRRSPNYGCSMQRNLGLTVANPRDLKRAQNTENYDGNRGASIIESYRAPPAAAAAPAATPAAQ